MGNNQSNESLESSSKEKEASFSEVIRGSSLTDQNINQNSEEDPRMAQVGILCKYSRITFAKFFRLPMTYNG